MRIGKTKECLSGTVVKTIVKRRKIFIRLETISLNIWMAIVAPLVSSNNKSSRTIRTPLTKWISSWLLKRIRKSCWSSRSNNINKLLINYSQQHSKIANIIKYKRNNNQIINSNRNKINKKKKNKNINKNNNK